MATTFSDTYKVKQGSTGIIYLTVVIGFAQTASTNVSLDGIPVLTNGKDEDGKPIKPDENGNYTNTFTIPLGTNDACKGKILLIVSTVTRIQENDNLSVIVTLKGGVADKTYKALKEKAAAKGDFKGFTPDITFTI